MLNNKNERRMMERGGMKKKNLLKELKGW